MQKKSTARKISNAKDVLSMIDKAFLIPPKTKEELKEAFPGMTTDEKETFVEYIESVIQKQENVISFILKYNPGFLTELKEFNAANERTGMKEIEKQVRKKDEDEMDVMETTLQNI